jgi:hypothetical protein
VSGRCSLCMEMWVESARGSGGGGSEPSKFVYITEICAIPSLTHRTDYCTPLSACIRVSSNLTKMAAPINFDAENADNFEDVRQRVLL